MAGVTPAVFAVVPAGLDDPARPSGGNTYDRRVLDALVERGWPVCERPVPGILAAARSRTIWLRSGGCWAPCRTRRWCWWTA